ncbi:MAG: DUF6090 family protein [Lutimonas sp.]
MITLFRKIRQKLMQQNQVSKYLLYAIGEIVLVVIGILIALQVNNWNELRKQRQVELKYFYNLKNDLLADDERLNAMIDLADSKVRAAKNVKFKADRDSISTLYDFSQEMLTLIFVDEFRPNDNTYEEMKSSGNFSTIRNDDLKLKLMNLKKTYHNIAATHEHMRYDFNVFLEDFEKHVDWGKYYDLSRSNIPNIDFAYDSLYIDSHKEIMQREVRELYKNKVFLNNIFLLEINYTYIIDLFNQTKSQISEITEILNREIEQK